MDKGQTDSQLNVSHDCFTLIEPRFRDFDLQGILNSAVYLELVGEARAEQMARNFQLPVEKYTRLNQSWILSHFSIEYKQPIKYGSKFFIETKVESIDGPKARVQFAFHNTSKSKTHAQGIIDYHLYDLATRKTISIDEDEKTLYLSK